MKPFALKPDEEAAPAHRAGVLLPLPLSGAYDYATDEKLPRGTIVAAPLGPREYLACESGELELWASGEQYQLTAGDVVVFRGDQNHSYKNPSRNRAVAYSVVVLAPG